MVTRPRRPPWVARVLGARIAARINPAVWRLTVPGRRTGWPRTVSVIVLDYDGERYLLAPSGDTDWSRNLRASGRATLRKGDRHEEIRATLLPVPERQRLIDTYLARYRKLPTVARAFRALPDPAQHPAFRISMIEHR